MNAAIPAVIAGTAAVAVSPVLAGWTHSLVRDERDRWWRPRPVGVGRWAAVAAVAAGFAALGSRGAPVAAWWLLAAVGAVLAIVDSETHRLPARLVGPLAAAEGLTLTATAIIQDEPHRLVRALLAGAAVAGTYFLVALIWPASLGLGDVYVAGIGSALLGWAGWNHVITGQIIIWLLGPFVLGVVAVAKPDQRGAKMHIPMGPALIAGTVIACWL